MKDVSLFEQLKQQAQKTIYYSELKEAGALIKEFEFQLKKFAESQRDNNKKEIEECFKILRRLKMLRLSLLKDEEANRLVKEHATEMLNDPDIDLAERIEARQLTVPELLRYEAVNQPLIDALRGNEEKIGENKIFIKSETEGEEEATPYVKNWLLDYDRTFGTEPQKDLVWLEYVKTNKNSVRLKQKEKETLRKLLKFYEFLKVGYIEEY